MQVKHLVDGEFKAVFHPVEGSGHYGRHDKGSPGSSSRVQLCSLNGDLLSLNYILRSLDYF
jgi:hypothetical protein